MDTSQLAELVTELYTFDPLTRTALQVLELQPQFWSLTEEAQAQMPTQGNDHGESVILG